MNNLSNSPPHINSGLECLEIKKVSLNSESNSQTVTVLLEKIAILEKEVARLKKSE